MASFEITLPSSLFPFALDDLEDFRYGKYRLQNVFRSINEAQRRACVELWLRCNVIPSADMAWQRSRQICYLITESESGRLVGVNTLYIDKIQQGGFNYFLNRMFIDPDYRNSRLMIAGTSATLCYGATRLHNEGIPGIVNINENRKLGRPGMHKIFTRLGYEFKGQQNGQDVWYFDFARVRFEQA